MVNIIYENRHEEKRNTGFSADSSSKMLRISEKSDSRIINFLIKSIPGSNSTLSA
jgi:hypothetical protein